MMSAKAMFAVSMMTVGASTLGISAYVTTRPSVSASSPYIDTEVVPLPRTKFEFVLASSMAAETSTVAEALQLDPVTIYGRDDSAHIGTQQAPVLQPCSEWRSLASGPASRRVKDLCLWAQ